jgi:DNA-binding CsgD family transcriptional regulator
LDDLEMAAAYRNKALALTERYCDGEDLAEALARIALSEWVCSGAPQKTTLDRLMRHSKAAKIDRRVVTAFAFEAARRLFSCQAESAEQMIREGLSFVEDRQLDDFQQTHILSWFHAAVAVAHGHWDTAQARYEAIFRRPSVPRFMASRSRLQCALLAARQGRGFNRAWLSEAFAPESVHLLHDVYRLHRVHCEIAWLAGDSDAALRSADIARCIAEKWDHPWMRGEVALLQRLLGQQVEVSGDVAKPYALLFAGHWRDAAQSWKSLGYPYEEALALMFGDEDGQREALRILDSLGAKVVAERVRERMRRDGIRRIPRGPIARTKSNPAGLTDRELEVLALLADGLSNSSIAGRIHRSVKTVDHHVSAVIEKLGAEGRIQAVAIARQRSLLAKTG